MQTNVQRQHNCAANPCECTANQRQGTSDDQFCVMVTDKPVIYAVAYIPRISDPAGEINARGGGESRHSPRSKPDKLT